MRTFHLRLIQRRLQTARHTKLEETVERRQPEIPVSHRRQNKTGNSRPSVVSNRKPAVCKQHSPDKRQIRQKRHMEPHDSGFG